MKSTGGGRTVPCRLFSAARIPGPHKTPQAHMPPRVGRHSKKGFNVIHEKYYKLQIKVDILTVMCYNQFYKEGDIVETL